MTMTNLPTTVTRDRVLAFEEALKSIPEECKLTFDNLHDFADGVYARSLFLPAGSVCTGKIHKTRHFFVIMQGSCTVVDSNGGRKLLVAPYLGVTEPGIKRAVHVHEDCIWTTFHATSLTNVDEIEREVIASTFEEFDRLAEQASDHASQEKTP